MAEYLIPLTILTHLILSPYTKVEESFSIQAAHDILVYGTPTSDVSARLKKNYDHLTFSGAVPRSFIGPLLLAGVAQGPIAFLGFQHAQLIVRAVLGMFNAACLVFFARSVRKAFGDWAGDWFVMLICTQFHVMYYASRTLPNMFAFGLTTLAFSFLLPHPDPKLAPGRQRVAISLFAFSAVVFRAEIAVLLASTGLYLLLTGKSTLRNLVVSVIVSSAVALLVSVPIDCYFWQKPLWPELWGFIFNVVQGSSSEWGVSPWHYYFTSAIPRIILNPLALVLLIPTPLYSPATSRAARSLLVPSLLFVAIYSLQPHKEARFIFYVSPPLTAAAALGASTLSMRASKSPTARLLTLVLMLSVLASAAASAAMLLLSSLNYPGGDALSYIQTEVLPSELSAPGAIGIIAVHADVLACMTGVTLFGTNPHGHPKGARVSNVRVQFDKTEHSAELENPRFWSQFEYLLHDTGDKIPPGRWDTLAVVEGLNGIEILRPNDREEHKLRTEEKFGGEVVGKGKEVGLAREFVRRLTGGWWVGPRMVPRIQILKRMREGIKPTGNLAA
ncbi:related to ECM39 protein, involved in cell wall biogenesis and architecture [Cephalotrichum gorgonifer]|uniref:Mannosyltransferase n=1 Tax=Cephalotrichum gorgonifer TaxID=2041049 RepID=A0AAE8SR25_9PEZI|nr:related to ECM39 protein, involved in cell wall biogenesis and architecture [Cephalotrichum gorgonifer]